MKYKTIILFTLFPVFIAHFLIADTHIPAGDVSGTWDVDGSPYIVDGYVIVPVDSTLIIEPGVFVIFSTDNGLRVKGKLISDGTENDSIVFTVQDTSNITGLGFYHTDITNQDSSKITYSIFEHVSVCFDKSSNILFRKSSVSKCVGWSGVYFDENSCPTLIDVTISNNSTDYYGGGIYCTDGSCPRLVNVTISDNTAAGAGGVYCSYNSNPIFENVIITDNYPQGICCKYSSNPILNNVIIDGNEDIGITCYDDSHPILDNVIISNNKMGIDSRMCNPIITNTIITGNSPMGGFRSIGGDIILRNVIISDNENTDPSVICFGGGMHINGNVSIVNALIINNYISTVNVGGGGIFNVTGNLSLTNVVVSGNYAEPGCGGMWCQYGSNTSLTNSIFWNNNDSQGINKEIVVLDGGWGDEITISYTDIEEGQNGVSCGGTMNWGVGNINLDPLFSDSLYHLSEDSPCIDAGIPDTTGSHLPPWDLDGHVRVWDGNGDGVAIIDMGVYEYGAPVYSISEPEIPEQSMIHNYPNPFTESTTLQLSRNTEFTENTELKIYNIKGQLIKTIPSFPNPSLGMQEVVWDGKDDRGKNVGAGMYFIYMKTGESVNVKKILKFGM